MSYNEIAETFSEYSKGKSSNCQHLIELFQQAMIQMDGRRRGTANCGTPKNNN